jgi:hypothetical protein
MARRSFRHCERSAAIHGVGSSTMDRHGLRPRDDEGVDSHSLWPRDDECGPSWRDAHPVIASAARQSTALVPPRWIATARGLAMTKGPVMARRSFRHCERSAAIHGVGFSTMDRHGLRPRDDEGVGPHGPWPRDDECGRSWRDAHSVIASAARQSTALVSPRWIATACGLAMTKEWIPTARGLAMTNVARHGATLIPSLRAQRGNPRRWFIHHGSPRPAASR